MRSNRKSYPKKKKRWTNANRFQALQLEAIDGTSFATIHVITECQNDLYKKKDLNNKT